jgi:hypothetical protein
MRDVLTLAARWSQRGISTIRLLLANPSTVILGRYARDGAGVMAMPYRAQAGMR